MKKLMSLTLLLALLLSLSPLSGALAASGIPEEYIGDWRGSADGIYLSFSIESDGTGTYIFDQNGYRESYGFTLSVDSGSFAVQIPADNKLGIVSCEGSYTYADDTLTLRVKTTMSGGRVFEYTVPCERAVAAGGVPEEYIGKWAGQSGNISLTFEIGADSRAKFTFRQGNYTGSNDVALSVADKTFEVEVPADDRTTKSTGGSYSYSDGILTVNVENVFYNGQVFRYTVHCERVED